MVNRFTLYHEGVLTPATDDWLGLTNQPLPLQAALDWVVLPSCGAVVFFSGTVRDHAQGRDGVTQLEYEAYDRYVVPKLAAIAQQIRQKWADVGRVVLLHRIGVLALGEAAVVVVVSAPHRREAFAAARFGIDTLKAEVPIWKKETWAGGADWGFEAQHTQVQDSVASVGREK